MTSSLGIEPGPVTLVEGECNYHHPEINFVAYCLTDWQAYPQSKGTTEVF